MSRQLSLFGAPPAANLNLYFAVVPEDSSAAAIADVCGRYASIFGLQGRPLKANHLHVSLHGLGRYDRLPDGLVDFALHVGSRISQPSFDVGFDRLMAFSGSTERKPFVLCSEVDNADLTTLHRRLGLALGNVAAAEGKNFKPHMTFMYGKHFSGERIIEPIIWTATKFVLILSHIGKDLHEHLGTWRLVSSV